MSRICITLLVTLMFCIPGCGPSERERFEATEKLLSAWDKEIIQSKAEYIRLLISEGADVNAKDIGGMTPLMYATLNSDTEAVALLISKGAGVNAKDHEGWTPLFFVTDPEIGTLLRRAGAIDSNGPLEYSERLRLLLEVDYPRNINDIHRPQDRIRVLVSQGVDVNTAYNHVGRFPLLICTSRGWAEAVEVLLAAGADVNAKNMWGETALTLNGHVGIIKDLLEAGADVNVKDIYGRTPLSRHLQPEIIKLLKAAGAKE